MAGRPRSTPNSPAQGLGCPYSGSSLYNTDVLAVSPFSYLCPVDLCTGSLPLPSQGPAQSGHVHSGLSQMSLTSLKLLRHISHKLSPPPDLGAVMAFPSHFISFCHSPPSPLFYISYLLLYYNLRSPSPRWPAGQITRKSIHSISYTCSTLLLLPPRVSTPQLLVYTTAPHMP